MSHRRDAPPRSEPASTLEAGSTLAGRFEIVAILGAGAVGEVYEARDRELGERVALKVLRRRVAGDERSRARFRREVQLARRVTHPNVCRLHDLFREGELTFLTMELLHGETLKQRLDRVGRLAPEEAVTLLAALADGLAAAHAAGVVHRDLKSGNVFLEPTAGGGERVVITDFGLARHGDDETVVTATGELVGSPAYMAPEQVTGEPVTAATDVYALGVVAFEMVTGRLPFAADTAVATALKRLTGPPPSPREVVPELDPAWERALATALAPDPAERFADPRELLLAVTRGATAVHGAPPGRWAGVAALLGGLALVAAAVAAILWLEGRPTDPPAAGPPAGDPATAAAPAAPETPDTAAPAAPDGAAAEAQALLDEGNRLFRAGDGTAAEEAYSAALAAWERIGDPERRAAALNNLGNVHARRGDLETATGFYQRALELRREVGDPEMVRRAVLNLGGHHYRRGDLERARRLFQEAVVLARSAGDDGAVAHTLTFLGIILHMDGDLEQAEDAFRQAHELFGELGAVVPRASLEGDLAAVALARGRVGEAAELARRAAETLRREGDRGRLASVVVSRAELALLRGDLGAAEERVGEALALWNQVGDAAAAARARVLRARIETAGGELAAAAATLETAISELEEIGGNSGLHEALAARGELARIAGDPAAARRDQERALAIRRDIGSRLGAAESLVALARLTLVDGLPAEAEALAGSAAETFAAAGSPAGEAAARTVMAAALRVQDKTGAAALEVRRAGDLAVVGELPPLAVELDLERGRLAAARGAGAAAAARFEAAARRARELGLVEPAIEAELGLARLHDPEDRGAALERLAARAEERGYLLLADRARRSAA